VSVPDWLDPLPEPELMRATDRWAIEERGIPSLALMERAGEGLTRVTGAHSRGGRIVVVCGKGNNGGDGLVTARLLRAAGRDVEVLAVWPPDELRGDAKVQLERLPGDPPQPFAAGRLAGAGVLVDAVLGTGFSGAPRAPADAVLAALGEADAPVVAADVPSGVNAETGEVEGAAVRAAATATFHLAKPGLWIAPGKDHAGRVEVIPIGIPRGAPGGAATGLLTPRVLDVLPSRGAASTKFSSGNVVVIGGSPGLTGAPAMTALAAARTGAGYVTVAASASLELAFAARLLEAMFRPLPHTDGALGPAALDAALAAVARADAVVLGPGLGRGDGVQALVRELAARIEVPLVLDADGLNALGGRYADVLSARSAPTVLTPHAGELSRLLETESAAVGAQRLGSARGAAAAARAIVVLKGDDTLVADPDGLVAVSPGGAPALATAGTGDVLSGVIAALLAKGVEPFRAAAGGVFAHVCAGRLAAAAHGPEGVVASDVITALPAALARPT